MQFMALILCSYRLFGAQDQENSSLVVELESYFKFEGFFSVDETVKSIPILCSKISNCLTQKRVRMEACIYNSV